MLAQLIAAAIALMLTIFQLPSAPFRFRIISNHLIWVNRLFRISQHQIEMAHHHQCPVLINTHHSQKYRLSHILISLLHQVCRACRMHQTCRMLQVCRVYRICHLPRWLVFQVHHPLHHHQLISMEVSLIDFLINLIKCSTVYQLFAQFLDPPTYEEAMAHGGEASNIGFRPKYPMFRRETSYSIDINPPKWTCLPEKSPLTIKYWANQSQYLFWIDIYLFTFLE